MDLDIARRVVENGDISDPNYVTAAQMVLAEAVRLSKLIGRPSVKEFIKSVMLEAAHQRERWGPEYTKSNNDFGAVATYLNAKALHAGWKEDWPKLAHHVVTQAALLANWHERLMTIEKVAAAIKASEGQAK